jgi:hypothetical protein
VARDAAHSGADALAVVSPAVAYSAVDSSSGSSQQQQQQQQQVHALWTVSGAAASSDSYSTVSDTPVYIRVAGTDSAGRELVAVVTQLPATGVLTPAVCHDVWMEVSACYCLYTSCMVFNGSMCYCAYSNQAIVQLELTV